jgi:hypothetical protein
VHFLDLASHRDAAIAHNRYQLKGLHAQEHLRLYIYCTLQESSSSSAATQLPKGFPVILMHDAADSCHVGDSVEITGLLLLQLQGAVSSGEPVVLLLGYCSVLALCTPCSICAALGRLKVACDLSTLVQWQS